MQSSLNQIIRGDGTDESFRQFQSPNLTSTQPILYKSQINYGYTLHKKVSQKYLDQIKEKEYTKYMNDNLFGKKRKSESMNRLFTKQDGNEIQLEMSNIIEQDNPQANDPVLTQEKIRKFSRMATETNFNKQNSTSNQINKQQPQSLNLKNRLSLRQLKPLKNLRSPCALNEGSSQILNQVSKKSQGFIRDYITDRYDVNYDKIKKQKQQLIQQLIKYKQQIDLQK